ncbi:nuclear transport factor 2 family protein [Paraburkholderia elongata]|uniref:Nuclear transport factor 2 family protein n=1 Tax=Paraburkholderia elongata TaxID=2675747 RepID=A0A972NUP3_9BURK|nr:nuclear transport factor 2 family protein [Paraburkholderia elongata]NPT59287.1 nuclear transport factor 2 family protein [Paraburkholderia elongata]
MTELNLEQRLRAIEDQLEIYRLIASHPPSADTGADFYTRQVYTADGVFDLGDELEGARGNLAVAAITKTPGHQQAIASGLIHFTGLPIIELEGDTAYVTSYLQIITPDSHGEPRELPNHGVTNGFRIHGVWANRWSLVRTSEGWKINNRSLRLLDGSSAGREILEKALERYQSNDAP